MNNELRENQINRDYYLKRAIIYLLGVGFAPFVVIVLLFVSNGSNIALAVSLVIFSVVMSLEIYYATKSWKAHKACQELANPTLPTEAEREREREINLGVSSQWAETLVY